MKNGRRRGDNERPEQPWKAHLQSSSDGKRPIEGDNEAEDEDGWRYLGLDRERNTKDRRDVERRGRKRQRSNHSRSRSGSDSGGPDDRSWSRSRSRSHSPSDSLPSESSGESDVEGSRSWKQRHRDRSRSRSRSREVDRSSAGARNTRRRSSPDRSHSREDDSEGGLSCPAFEPAAVFHGARFGMLFTNGSCGVGYYRDEGSHANALAAERATYQAALASSQDGMVDVPSSDAPIVAALRSHRDGLAAVRREVGEMQRNASHWHNRQAFVRAGQVLEVRLTDQLLVLQQMLDDCVSAEGRAAVKLVIGQLKELGKRIESSITGR